MVANCDALAYSPPTLLYLHVEQGWHKEATKGGLRPSGHARVYTIDVRNRDIAGNGGKAHDERVARKFVLAKGFFTPPGFMPRLKLRDEVGKNEGILEHPTLATRTRKARPTGTAWNQQEPAAPYSAKEAADLAAEYSAQINIAEAGLSEGYNGFDNDDEEILDNEPVFGQNYFDPTPFSKDAHKVPEVAAGGMWSFFTDYQAGLVEVPQGVVGSEGQEVGVKIVEDGEARYVIRMPEKLVNTVAYTQDHKFSILTFAPSRTSTSPQLRMKRWVALSWHPDFRKFRQLFRLHWLRDFASPGSYRDIPLHGTDQDDEAFPHEKFYGAKYNSLFDSHGKFKGPYFRKSVPRWLLSKFHLMFEFAGYQLEETDTEGEYRMAAGKSNPSYMLHQVLNDELYLHPQKDLAHWLQPVYHFDFMHPDMVL